MKLNVIKFINRCSKKYQFYSINNSNLKVFCVASLATECPIFM